LLKYLKDLRKKVAKEFGVPPFVVFQYYIYNSYIMM
ncbi:MAG: HRDC domain-containing protein, partial [Veillonella parvula]